MKGKKSQTFRKQLQSDVMDYKKEKRFEPHRIEELDDIL